eukprot:scaffold47414_cov29-Tisochrysis_lutea.AAC.4
MHARAAKRWLSAGARCREFRRRSPSECALSSMGSAASVASESASAPVSSHLHVGDGRADARDQP